MTCGSLARCDSPQRAQGIPPDYFRVQVSDSLDEDETNRNRVDCGFWNCWAELTLSPFEKLT